MSSTRKVITIDGLAASGKSAVGRLLAKKLNFAFFSSGILYRLVAYSVVEERVDPKDEVAVLACINRHKFAIEIGPDGSSLGFLDGENITSSLSSPEISEATSILSALPKLREALL